MPAPLRSPPPNAPTPTPARAPETDPERRARHLDMLREMAELSMAVARDAAAKATNPTPDPDAPDPGRTFARATHAARQAIALEARIAAGGLPPIRGSRPASGPAAPPDPRRPLLRQALHKAAQNEPNRAALRREIEEGIELELLDDPEAELAVAEILAKLSEQLGLPFDPSILPDHFLAPTPSPNLSPVAAHPTDPAPPKPHPFHIRE